MKKVLAVNCGWEQAPTIQRIIDEGYEVHGVHHDDGYDKKLKLKSLLKADYFDLDSISKFFEQKDIDYIFTDQCDHSIFTAAYLSEKYSLSGPSLSSIIKTTNKWIQRTELSNSKIRQPKFTLIKNFSEIEDFFLELKKEIIIKPIDARGSFGVHKVDSITNLKEKYLDAVKNSKSKLVIAEEFINGYQITVDGFCFDGSPKSLAVGFKRMISGSKQVAIGIDYDLKRKLDIVKKAKDVNDYIAQKLNLSFGFIHGEYMVDKNNDIYLVELANRGGGVFTSTICDSIASGVDLEGYLLESFGISVKKKNIEKNSVSLSFITFNQRGKIKKIIGESQVNKLDEVHLFKLNIKEGDMLNDVSSDANRHAFAIIKGDMDSAENIRNKIIEKLSIVTDEQGN